MTKLTRRRARTVARSDATATAKIIAVQEAQIEEEFLAYIVLPNGRTVGDFMVPHVRIVGYGGPGDGRGEGGGGGLPPVRNRLK